MGSYTNMLTATRYVAGTVLTIGIAIFLFGVFVNDFNTLIGVGLGTVMGAVFIFVIGLFLIATEEMVAKSRKCEKESA